MEIILILLLIVGGKKKETDAATSVSLNANNQLVISLLLIYLIIA
ncbi:hypothetical protein [Listeria seeligeri]|nr:hypothetical protein [Listeria seeligeri]